jgi:hypothetical protein
MTVTTATDLTNFQMAATVVATTSIIILVCVSRRHAFGTRAQHVVCPHVTAYMKRTARRPRRVCQERTSYAHCDGHVQPVMRLLTATKVRITRCVITVSHASFMMMLLVIVFG